jgi:hypothetical protein
LRQARGLACTETIDRTYLQRPHTVDCDKAAADIKLGRTPLAAQVTDRVRIQVTEIHQQEAHALPGATRFDDVDIDQLIQRGPAATGAYGGYLTDIFANEATQFSFADAKDEGGRRVFAYEFRVDEESSHYKVRTDSGWVTAGFDGSFAVDAARLELLRVTLNTLPLPRETGLCEARSSMEYANSRVGGTEFFLPRESMLNLVFRGTLETNSAAVFSDCHEYSDETARRSVASASDARELQLPAETKLAVKLDAPIDSNTAAAGDVVTATLTRPVVHPLSQQVLVREGGAVHGRLTRMEHWVREPRQFVLAIHWDSITQDGETARLQAELSRDPQPMACEGEHAGPKGMRGLPPPPRLGAVRRAGEIEGRRDPAAPALRETLPVQWTNAQRCVIAKGQELELVTAPEERRKQ